MQGSFTRSTILPTHVSCFELRSSAWMMTAALLSIAPGCSTISDAPHPSISTSAVLPAQRLSENPPANEPQIDIPSPESPPAAITPRAPETQQASPAPTLPPPAPSTMIETGLASWYGARHHGKRTASGEIFDQNKLTAAHRTLPWGSIVKVTNLDNGKSVEVRINDRGPFKKGRIIDLSRAAARALEMLQSGVSPVQMELLSPREMANDLVLQNSQSRPAADSN
jgi:rare lipoprotein A